MHALANPLKAMTTNLLDFDLHGLQAFCEGLGEKRFRAQQLFRWIHQRGESDFDRMTDLALVFRQKLKSHACIKGLDVISSHTSVDGPSSGFSPLARAMRSKLSSFRNLTGEPCASPLKRAAQ